MASKNQRMGGLSLSSFSKAASTRTDTTADDNANDSKIIGNNSTGNKSTGNKSTGNKVTENKVNDDDKHKDNDNEKSIESSAQEETSFIKLDDIKDRASDTRELNEEHVRALYESIGAVGLIESLVTDRDGKLLAGGHRKAAITLLKTNNLEQYKQHFPDDKIPVRVMDFSAEASPDLALEIEVSENEVRRDYSKEEVLAIAQRLRDAGYKDTPGKPKKGEKRLKPAIQTIIGKSMRTVERYLASEKSVTPTNGEVRKDKIRKDEISEADKHLQKAIAHLEKWQKTKGEKNREKALMTEIDNIMAHLRGALE